MTPLRENKGRLLSRGQFERLRILGNGAMLVSGGNKRDWGGLHRRGLVVGELGAQGMFINGVQITPDGLRALAAYMDAHGLAVIRDHSKASGRCF